MTRNQSLHPAARLLMLRTTLGLSQRHLAKEFQVSSAAIASWETGTRMIPGPVLKLMGIYEKSLPAGQNDFSHSKVLILLEEMKKSFGISKSQEDLDFFKSFQSGVVSYFEESSSVNRIRGKLKLLMIQKLIKSLEDSKGLSIKIAQIASFLEMGLPGDIRRALGTLQSRCKPSRASVIRAIVEEEYGMPLKEVFVQWRDEPIAVTSLAQVHFAVLATGEEVAVKIQHPGIREILEKQFRNVELLTSLGSFFNKKDSQIIDEIKRSLFQECDYPLEARNQEKFRNIFSENTDVIVPRVFQDLTRSRVLVTEYIRAENFQTFVAGSSQKRKNEAAEIIMEALTQAAFSYFSIYSDLQPGNFLFKDGKVVILDFGRVIDCPAERMRAECRFYFYFLNQDYEASRELAGKLFARDESEFDFDAFWKYLSSAHVHLMIDKEFKFTRDYARRLSREGSAFSKKHQLNLSKDVFWAFVFSASTWGVMSDLEASLNFRRMALKRVSTAAGISLTS